MMAEWDCDQHADDVALLVSELVTNAILHARGDIGVTLRRGERAVRVEVADASPALPTRRPCRDDDVHGRGLHLVEALADEWGVDPPPAGRDGKVVWCEVRV